MSNVIQFEIPDSDLPNDKWFYEQIGQFCDDAYDKHRNLIECSPFGSITLDDLYEAAEKIPVEVVALARNYHEGEAVADFLEDVIVQRAVLGKLSRPVAND